MSGDPEICCDVGSKYTPKRGRLTSRENWDAATDKSANAKQTGNCLLAHVYPLGYNAIMVEIRQTEIYANWFAKLRDRQARARIDVRIRRLTLGNHGDVRPVGEGVSELRIDYGPGYRIYLVQRGSALVILLAGGDKRTQDQDIQVALKLAREIGE